MGRREAALFPARAAGSVLNGQAVSLTAAQPGGAVPRAPGKGGLRLPLPKETCNPWGEPIGRGGGSLSQRERRPLAMGALRGWGRWGPLQSGEEGGAGNGDGVKGAGEG